MKRLNSSIHSLFNNSHSPLADEDFLDIECSDSFSEDSLCSEDQILDMLASLDVTKSNGPDNISARMLKVTATSLVPPLAALFNLSLQLVGKIPQASKRSRVVPIPKVSAPKSPDNYHPISLLSVLSKILVYNVIASHLESNPLTDCQWGFRFGRSTVWALLTIVDEWLRILEDGKEICAIFFDYRKAFDSVPHRPLMQKLFSLNLNSFLSRWISDYLTNRTQQVVVDSATSSAIQVLLGGSVLGPLLFLIYVDEVSSVHLSQGSKLNLFADDLLLFKVISRLEDYAVTQDDIRDAIADWSDDNHLVLNPAKCKCMVISRKKKLSCTAPQLLLNNHPLDQIDTFKYLGVLLSCDVSWSSHISAICSKARQVIAHLYRKFYPMANSDTVTHLYTTLVQSQGRIQDIK